MNPLVSRTWSPYAAGILIGLLQIPAFLLAGTALGVSSSFVTVAASFLSFVDSTALTIPYFKSHVASAKDWWQVALMGGIVIGAFISTRLAGTKRPAMSAFWPRVAGIQSFGQRIALGFVGGIVLLLGARIANGCTTGHGLSGLSQLAVSSFIAVTAIFVGGIVASMFLKKV
jgi:uncharacterized membrane protein YedE/YeeE